MTDQSYCDILALEHFAEEIIKHPNAEATKALGSLVNLGGLDAVFSLSVALRLCLVQLLSSCCEEPEVEMDYAMLVEGLEALDSVLSLPDDDPTVRKNEIDDIVRERIPSLLERARITGVAYAVFKRAKNLEILDNEIEAALEVAIKVFAPLSKQGEGLREVRQFLRNSLDDPNRWDDLLDADKKKVLIQDVVQAARLLWSKLDKPRLKKLVVESKLRQGGGTPAAAGRSPQRRPVAAPPAAAKPPPQPAPARAPQASPVKKAAEVPVEVANLRTETRRLNQLEKQVPDPLVEANELGAKAAEEAARRGVVPAPAARNNYGGGAAAAAAAAAARGGEAEAADGGKSLVGSAGKRKADRKITWDSDSGDDEEDGKGKRAKKAPGKSPGTNTALKKLAAAARANLERGEKPPSRARRFKYEKWTDAELDFVRQEYKRLRPGRHDSRGTWAQIRDNGRDLLLGRTPQDIRDKIRGMVKKGEKLIESDDEGAGAGRGAENDDIEESEH